jgi:hypothetical protein
MDIAVGCGERYLFSKRSLVAHDVSEDTAALIINDYDAKRRSDSPTSCWTR